MSKITDLSTELLDEILRRKGLRHSAIFLWLCGDKRLHHLMRHGGVTDVLLEDTKWNTTSRWPKMLAELRFLRRLSVIRGCRRLGYAEDIGMELQRLTPRLEELVLAFPEAEECFGAPAGPQVALLFENPDQLAGAGVWDVAATFPKLRVLDMSYHRPFLVDSDWQRFPSSLQVLINENCRIEDPSYLPRGLTSLSIDYVNLELLNSLPPGLTTCHLQDQINYSDPLLNLAKINRQFVEWVPSSLTDLRPRIPLLSTEWHTHPPSLRQMAPFSCTFEDLPLLPANITKLRLERGKMAWEAHHIRLLPRGLLSLSIYPQNLPNTGIHDWPPTLGKMHIRLDQTSAGVAYETFSTFPLSLKTLKVIFAPTARQRILARPTTASLRDRGVTFPANLTHVVFTGDAHFLVGLLPQSVTKMSLHQILKCPPLVDFPAGLKELTMDTNVPYNEPVQFPPSLISFSNANGNSILTDDFLGALPRNLTSLHLIYLQGIQEKPLKNWPPNLTYLDVGSVYNVFDPNHIQFLPSGLHILTIPIKGQLEDHHMAALPRNLRQLSMQQGGHQLTINALTRLPPHLVAQDSTLGQANDLLKIWRQRETKIESKPLVTPDLRVLERYRHTPASPATIQ